MSYVFISGIPASGKTYLAAKVSRTLGISHFDVFDKLYLELSNDPNLMKWVNFFWNLNEEKYYETADCAEQWENIKNQSEALWPVTLKKIKDIQASKRPAIFEGVNILPHLARRDLDFEGIFLLGESLEIIFERNKKNPRWGKTEELQRKEAKAFYECEGAMYKKEADKYGFKTFSDTDEAEKELLRILKS